MTDRSLGNLAQPVRILALVVSIACASCGGGGGGDATASSSSIPPPSTPPSSPAPPGSTPPPATQPAPSGPNRNPTLVNAIPDQQGRGGRAFALDLSQGGTTFTDPDGDPLTYTAAIYGAGLSLAGPMLIGTLPANGSIVVAAGVQDGRNGFAEQYFTITIAPNAGPVATSPNLAIMTSPGVPVNYDATKSGTTFMDADGDLLAYQLTLVSPPRGLAVNGTRVVGSLAGVGVVTFELTATDVLGAQGKDRFSIAVAAPPPGAPVLPRTSYVYADAQLPLPELFATTHLNPPGQFWDPDHETNPTTNAGATLGRVLFYDKRLSITNTHACGSCHHQANGFADPRRFPIGVQDVPLKRHAMALSNVRFNINERWFSDLRADTLEELALMPIQEPTELGNYLPLVEEKLSATLFYPTLFEAAFGTREISGHRVALALAQFLRTLTSYRSRYDAAYLGSAIDETVLTPQELLGREIFLRSPKPRCGFCHLQDVQQTIGATSNGLDAVITDPGVIGPGGPTGWFRAPSLRNVAASAPYMHDGRFATLREVIDHYDHGIQDSPALDADLREPTDSKPKRMNFTGEEKAALEAFLRTLTDDAFLTDPKFADPFF